MIQVAALYIDPRGPYPAIPGVDAWDEARDARLYAGPHAVVAHPPCGPWGSLRKMCLQDGTLAPMAVEQVRKWGGVLEHPANSLLWKHCNLPPPITRGQMPFADEHGGVTIQIEQVSWGHSCRKPTFLYIVRCDIAFVMSSILTGGTPTHTIASSRKKGGLLAPSQQKRRRSPPTFAAWLVQIARTRI